MQPHHSILSLEVHRGPNHGGRCSCNRDNLFNRGLGLRVNWERIKFQGSLSPGQPATRPPGRRVTVDGSALQRHPMICRPRNRGLQRRFSHGLLTVQWQIKLQAESNSLAQSRVDSESLLDSGSPSHWHRDGRSSS